MQLDLAFALHRKKIYINKCDPTVAMRTPKSSQTYVIKAAGLSAGCQDNHNAVFSSLFHTHLYDCVCAQGLGSLSLTKMLHELFIIYLFL